MGHQHPGHSGLTEEGEGSHVHGVHRVGAAHQDIACGLGYVEGTGGGAKCTVDRLGLMIEMPHQSLGLIGHPDATVVQLDISCGHPPMDQGEDPERERDKTNQCGLNALARDQSHAFFSLRSRRSCDRSWQPHPLTFRQPPGLSRTLKAHPGPSPNRGVYGPVRD